MCFSVVLVVLCAVLSTPVASYDKRSHFDGAPSRVSRETTYKVGVLEMPPYVILDKSKTGHERFSGFLVDVLSKMSEMMRVKFEFYLQEDGHPGQLVQKTGNWDGLVGKVLQQKIDIIAGPLHVTAANERVLKLTAPVASTGISFLVRLPKLKQRPQLMFLLEVFSNEIWISFVIMLIIIAILFYVISRFSPYSRTAQSPPPPPQNGVCKSIRDSSAPFSVKNSCLFIFNTFTFQGHSNVPKSWASRILGVFWAAFCLWIIVAYAANLAVWFIAHAQVRPPVVFHKNPLDIMRHGGLIDIVKDRYEDIALRTMSNDFHNFAERKNSFIGSYEEGIKALERSNGNQALAMDSLAAEYVALRHCNFRKFNNINSVSIGFAVAIGSRGEATINVMNQAILKLREDGTLQASLKKWLNNGARCPQELISNFGDDQNKGNDIRAHTVYLKEMTAAFLLIVIGAVVAIVVFIAEVIFVRIIKQKFCSNERSRPTEVEEDDTKEQPLVASS